MALTPVAVLMFRFNNPDAMLVLLLVASAYATLRAVEASTSPTSRPAHGPPAGWRFAGVLVGLAFLAKMLQAFLVVPPLVLVYAVFAGVTWRRKLLHLLAAAGGLVMAAGLVDRDRLALAGRVPSLHRGLAAQLDPRADPGLQRLRPARRLRDRLRRRGDGVGGGGQWGATGLLRMFGTELGSQVAWLLPAALVLGVVALLFARGRRPLQAGLTLWLGWLLVTALTFSLMAGIFHPYYTVALAPAIGALVGIGSVGALAASRLAGGHRRPRPDHGADHGAGLRAAGPGRLVAPLAEVRRRVRRVRAPRCWSSPPATCPGGSRRRSRSRPCSPG